MIVASKRKGCLRFTYMPCTLLILIADFIQIQRYIFVSSAIHVVGIVINSWSDLHNDEVLSQFGSKDGRIYSVLCTTSSGSYDQKGSPIPIIYDASNPSYAELDAPDNLLSPISEFLVIFGLSLFTAAFLSDRSAAKKQ